LKMLLKDKCLHLHPPAKNVSTEQNNKYQPTFPSFLRSTCKQSPNVCFSSFEQFLCSPKYPVGSSFPMMTSLPKLRRKSIFNGTLHSGKSEASHRRMHKCAVLIPPPGKNISCLSVGRTHARCLLQTLLKPKAREISKRTKEAFAFPVRTVQNVY